MQWQSAHLIQNCSSGTYNFHDDDNVYDDNDDDDEDDDDDNHDDISIATDVIRRRSIFFLKQSKAKSTSKVNTRISCARLCCLGLACLTQCRAFLVAGAGAQVVQRCADQCSNRLALFALGTATARQ